MNNKKASAEMERQALLTLAADLTALYSAPGGGTKSETRARYAAALTRITAFVERLNVPVEAFMNLEALARLFGDLERGTVSPLFQDDDKRGGRRLDPAELWRIRADAALGFQCLLSASGGVGQANTKAATARQVSKEYKSLSRLLRSGSTIAICLPNWHALLASDEARLSRGEQTKIPADAVASFKAQRAVIAAGVLRGGAKALGERLLKQANAQAALLPKWYRAR